MNEIIIALGSNQGMRTAYLDDARQRIAGMVGRLIKISPIIESEPWGYNSTNWYLNQIIGVESTLDPENVLEKLQEIEREMGRVPSTHYIDRPIDLDILDVLSENSKGDNGLRKGSGGDNKLVIPHPRMHDRKFVLLPLAEIYPDYIHPLLNMSVSQMIKECNDNGRVRWFNDPHHP